MVLKRPPKTRWDDPCKRAALLREAYHKLLSGEAETLINVKGPDGSREVQYAKPDLAALKREMQEAEDACAAANGLTPAPRRHAITLGARRRWGFW